MQKAKKLLLKYNLSFVTHVTDVTTISQFCEYAVIEGNG